MRLEIDWETSFGEVAYVASDNSGSITSARKNISIKNPVLLLDYLTFDEEARAGLMDVLQNGAVIPYIHTSLSEKVIPANTSATSVTSDILLALQGKLLMKMYVSHRLSDSNTSSVDFAPQIGNGRCRSQRGLNMTYNLYVNDLAIHDLPVDTASQQYSFFSMAQQAFASVVPGSVEYNALRESDASATTDVNSTVYTASGVVLPVSSGITGPKIRDMVSGCQSYIAFDLSKYPQGSSVRGGRVIPADAGFRSGSSAVILRITQTGGSANTPEALPKTITVFTEEVKVLQIRGMMADVLDA